MAGYVYNLIGDENDEFHFGPGVGDKIRETNKNRRVLILQLDGDELDAALWGLDNYQKGTN
jgi:hypothetical protein